MENSNGAKAHPPRTRRLGIWLVGAHGGVATTTAVGTLAIRKGLAVPRGLVTELSDFSALDLAPLSGVSFGGWELRPGTWREAAHEIQDRSGTFKESLLGAVEEDLAGFDRWVKPGLAAGCGEAIGALAPGARREHPVDFFARAVEDLARFRREARLDAVVVVNVASSEPPPAVGLLESLTTWTSFAKELKRRLPRLPASVVYAAAAIEARCPYVNFTSSAGSNVPALAARALKNGVPHMGADGKTGETWVKTVLAPAFLARNLKILSWEGHNILGDGDGRILAHLENARAKLQDKDQALRRILKDPAVHSRVRIDYVPSLDDWKTAWDFIHFEGFLGVKMILQFIWQGCDAALAAPLILDLARLVEFAQKGGEAGWMTHLACFFKNPRGVEENGFEAQFERLRAYVRAHVQNRRNPPLASSALFRYRR